MHEDKKLVMNYLRIKNKLDPFSSSEKTSLMRRRRAGAWKRGGVNSMIEI